MTWVQTFTGRAVDIIDPTPDQIDFMDMAFQLERILRFRGAARCDISVARHSINVADALARYYGASPETCLYGLLHDGHEMIVGDMPSPQKKVLEWAFGSLEPMREIERGIDRAIFAAAGLPPDPTEEQRALVKLADSRMLATEKRDFLANCAREWDDLPAPFPDPFPHTTPDSDDSLYFMMKLNALRKAIEAEKVLHCA